MTVEKARQALKRLLANGPLTGLPTRRSDLELLLRLAASRFDAQGSYREAEVNDVLREWLKTFSAPFGIDHVTLRRCLVDLQYLDRDRSGSTYRPHPDRSLALPPAVEPADVLAEITSERAARKRQRASRASMQLRLLGPADAQAFQQIRLNALRDTPSAFSSSYEEERDTPLAAVAEQLTRQPERFVIGAFEDGRLIGIAGLHREAQAKLSHKAVLWGVYVAPEARKRGTGRKLLARAIEEAASMPGLTQINLSVNSANAAALALYEGLGFSSFGLERGYLQVDGVLHDEIHMARPLP